MFFAAGQIQHSHPHTHTHVGTRLIGGDDEWLDYGMFEGRVLHIESIHGVRVSGGGVGGHGVRLDGGGVAGHGVRVGGGGVGGHGVIIDGGGVAGHGVRVGGGRIGMGEGRLDLGVRRRLGRLLSANIV